MSKAEPIELRIVAFQDEGRWVAQCLEYDIAAHAADLDTVLVRIEDTICAEAEHTKEQHGEPFKGIDPAPDLFEAMWDRSMTSVVPPEVAASALTSKFHYKIAA